MEIKVRKIAEHGLPDMDKLVGRVAFIFDGCIVSGWPIYPEFGDIPWEANEDVGRPGKFYGITHWIEFPVAFFDMDHG